VAGSELAVGQTCGFELLADVYSSAEHSQEYPSLQIGGSAILRRVAHDSDQQLVRIGAQFTELPAEENRQLREWLAKNRSRLCLV
jgi:hypothetical protein